MTDLQVFSSEQFGKVRVADVDGRPMFAASDVAKALGYSRPADAVSSHCKGGSILPTPTKGGLQNVKYIPESDVYRLVMRSKLSNAEQFQDWVCEDVLPAIRKSGGYVVSKQDDTPDVIMARALMVAKETIERYKGKVLELERQKELDSPKVKFAEDVEASDSSILMSELSKILKQNGVNIGQHRLFAWMRGHGYLGKQCGSYNLPTQKSMNLGLMEIQKRFFIGSNKIRIITNTTKVTPKGQIYFVNKFLSDNNNNAN